MEEQQRIAIVGSGIAGISAAWLLRDEYDVTLLERNDYFGGHTHTIVVEEQGVRVPVDTGFIVYNEPNYPHLAGLFDVLEIAARDTEMSFAASVGEPRIEYAGSDLDTLFAQRRNLVNPGFLRMAWDILRFNRLCKNKLEAAEFGDITIGGLLELEHLGQRFRDHYLLPMAAAIWSCPPQTMLDFPAASFARFFENHGLLDLKDRPQWKTVRGGGHNYANTMLRDLGPRVRCGDPVTSVVRKGGQVEIALASGERLGFDQIVRACHADEALALLADPLPTERQILSRFQYQPNRVLLHKDERLMPHSRHVWSSWNYLASQRNDRIRGVSVTYWMNRLQDLNTATDYFVSLNTLREPQPESVVAEMTYHHPVFDKDAVNAQEQLSDIQGRDRIWYTGSFFGYGFHDDALRASVELAGRFGVRAPWLPGRESRNTRGER